MRFLRNLILIFCVLTISVGHAEIEAPQNPTNYTVPTDYDFSDEKEAFAKLDKKTADKWENYREWQNNPEWVREQTDLGLYGLIYSAGWFGPKVSRSIVPDMVQGYLAVDTISIPANMLMTLGNIGVNILLSQYFPYVQVGVIHERSFINVRKFENYEDALLAPHFEFKKIPFFNEDFKEMDEGEQISTVTAGGVFARFGGGISHLIGLELPAHVNIGPKIKITYKKSLKLTIAKQVNNKVMIGIEKADEIGKGFGIGFGVYFDDIIDVPVTVGINSSNGYSPITFNIKSKNKTTKALVYELDLNDPKGLKAYHAFIKRDFTVMEDLAKAKDPAVSLEMIKEGKHYESEVNAAINLIFWRAGFRNIFKESKFNTTLKDGSRFEYVEMSAEWMTDKKSWGNYEQRSNKYSVLVPTRGVHSDFQEVEKRGGFILDSHYFYADDETYGSEINEENEELVQRGSQLRLPIRVTSDKNYEEVHIDVRVRFSATAMKRFINADSELIWEALGYAVGIPDPMDWIDSSSKRRWLKRGSSSQKSAKKKQMSKANKVVSWINKIRSQKTLVDKARELVKYLKKGGTTGHLLHKTLIDIAGQDQVLIRGYIRGKRF